MVDTNCAPDNVDYVIPGNDDAMRAISLYATGIADAVIEGRSQAPAVAVGEDEFVELDENGNPRKKGARSGAAEGAASAASAVVRPTPRRAAAVRWSRASPPIRKTVPIRPCSRTRAKRSAQRHGQRRSFAHRHGQCPGPWSRRWRRSAPRLIRPSTEVEDERMNIPAEAVKQLRERTGAGMMECKKALVETNGDLDAAAENMRKSGLAKADKKASRIAAEGVVVIEKSADGKTGVLVEVNSETDFVARGDDFRGFAAEVAKAALAANAAASRP